MAKYFQQVGNKEEYGSNLFAMLLIALWLFRRGLIEERAAHKGAARSGSHALSSFVWQLDSITGSLDRN